MKTLIAATGLAMLVAVPASAQVTASVGADYASGRYGTGQQVRSASSTFSLRAKRKRVTVFAALPVVQVDAPGNVIAPGGPLGLPIFTDPTRPATRERAPGWAMRWSALGTGDSAAPPSSGPLLTGSAKLPTASAARRLGTGKADYSVVAEAAVPGKVTPFAAVGHSFVGQPDGYRLRDVTSARGGVAVGIGKASEVSVSYNYASRVSDQVADRQEIGAGLDTALSQRLSLGLQAGRERARCRGRRSAGVAVVTHSSPCRGGGRAQP